MAPDKARHTGPSTAGTHPLHPRRIARGVTGQSAASYTGIVSAALVIIASKLGVELSAEEAVVIVAAAARVAEWLENRHAE